MEPADLLELIPDEPTEDDTERNGIFSYAGEGHSFIIGIVSVSVGGFPAAAVLVGAIFNEQVGKGEGLSPLAIHEVRREPWYALAGVAIGLLLHYHLKVYQYYPEGLQWV